MTTATKHETITNIDAYCSRHSVCRRFSSDTMTIWFYLREQSDGSLKIVNHEYMGHEMYWDGTGQEPIVVGAGYQFGYRPTKKDIANAIRFEIGN